MCVLCRFHKSSVEREHELLRTEQDPQHPVQILPRNPFLSIFLTPPLPSWRASVFAFCFLYRFDARRVTSYSVKSEKRKKVDGRWQVTVKNISWCEMCSYDCSCFLLMFNFNCLLVKYCLLFLFSFTFFCQCAPPPHRQHGTNLLTKACAHERLPAYLQPLLISPLTSWPVMTQLPLWSANQHEAPPRFSAGLLLDR